MTRAEEMSASRVVLKAELYFHDLSEEEDLSKLVTIFRNAAMLPRVQSRSCKTPLGKSLGSSCILPIPFLLYCNMVEKPTKCIPTQCVSVEKP